jgi:16S rRNA processing protein RimM
MRDQNAVMAREQSSKPDNVTVPEADWVVLASVVRPHGRRGEVIAELLTDFPERFAERKRLFLGPGKANAGGIREVMLEGYRLHKGRAVLKFAGIDSISAAEELRRFSVMLPLAERTPLKDDSVYVGDLVGTRVTDVHGGSTHDAGEIIDVLPEGPGPAMLVVESGATEPLLIPFVKAYLKKIDVQGKRIEMDLPEGLLAMQAPMTAEEWQRVREEMRSRLPDSDQTSHALRHR